MHLGVAIRELDLSRIIIIDRIHGISSMLIDLKEGAGSGYKMWREEMKNARRKIVAVNLHLYVARALAMAL